MIIEKFKEYLKSESYQLVPIISGAAALAFLGKIIFSDLQNYKYWIAVAAALVVFCTSSFLFYSLKKAEQDKDKYLLSTVGKVVEDVFRHYGQQMATRNAEMAKAEHMNIIMQTVVDLVGGLKELMQKSYTKN